MNNTAAQRLDFDRCFEALTGHAPMRWQGRLFDDFVQGNAKSTLDIPTGLGKTSVIAIWLLALMDRPDLMPRRLVYVVNRRTVVDQTTAEVERLREKLPRLNHPPVQSLAVSTLRGQFADNHEWSDDPSRPAVICGTVDMIGSRLLFGGYRIGFKSRPLHAGFLGQDALLVHDEAHLEPAFQQLAEIIRCEQEHHEQTDDPPWKKLQVLALSATARGASHDPSNVFTLESAELEHPLIQKRIEARKRLVLRPCEDEKKNLVEMLAERALVHKESEDAVLVFARRVSDAREAVSKIDKECPERVVALTGTMRGYERDHLVRRPVFARFLPESDRPRNVAPAQGAVYMVCTSAGEVGVNLSADHMVCDLTTFDSMAQRFGRVNRFGDRDDSLIEVVHPSASAFDEKDPLTPARKATLELFNGLNGDASPLALNRLDPSARREAFAPEPEIPQATDIHFDAWALTTIRETLPGRPSVEPYLHGIAQWEPPETFVAWRKEVGIITGDLLKRLPPADLLDDYPLKPHELLRDRSDRVFKHLEKLAKRHADSPAWVLDDHGVIEVTTLAKLADKQQKDQIGGRTILLPLCVGGLKDGMLDGTSEQADDVADHWLWLDDKRRRLRRKRCFSEDRQPDGPADMALIRTIDTKPDADEFEPPETQSANEEEKSVSKEQGRFWHWYTRPRDAEDATRSSTKPVALDRHTEGVVDRVKRITEALDWSEQWSELKEAIILAAELHDLGKRRELWQRSIGNPEPDGPPWYAKPGKPDDGPRWRPRFISRYRHEFGSLLDLLDPNQKHLARLSALSEPMQDVVLHLIAAHHGYARPHFPPEALVDPAYQQSAADEASIEVMRRYARLQRRYGRWGLAYLESLLRAADWAASAEEEDER